MATRTSRSRWSFDGQPRQPRAVVADDHDDSRELVQAYLTLKGFDVRTASDGMDAVEVAKDFEPDVVLLDIWMPRMDGIEACHCMREQPELKNASIFALTADRTLAPDQLDCFDACLAKPLDLEALLDLIDTSALRRNVTRSRSAELQYTP